VELGVAEGASAFSLRSTMRPEADLWLVDPFLAGALRWISVAQLVAYRLVGSVDNGAVHWVKSRSQEAGRSWKGPKVDLLFVDANHAYEAVCEDWDAWKPHLASDALVVFDEAGPEGCDGEGPRMLVEEIVNGEWNVVATGRRYAVIGR